MSRPASAAALCLLPAVVVAQPVAFEGVNLVAVDPPGVHADLTVLVRDGRIASIGATGDVRIPEGARRVRGRGRYLMPGLIEMHVHLREARLLGLYLAHGFTTVRDMNGRLGDTLAWRDEVARGERPGPRIVAAGVTLYAGAPEDHPYPVDTAEQARAAVRAMAVRGYDLVKVYRLKREPFRALMAEAHARGLPVAGHHPDTVHDQDYEAPLDIPNDEVVASGMVSLEHLDELIVAGLRMKPDDAALASLARTLRAHDVAVTTLLGQDFAVQEIRRLGQAWLTPERKADVRRWNGTAGIEAARRQIDFIESELPQDIADLGRFIPDFSLKMLRTFHEAGVTLVVGTDSHGAVVVGGRSGLGEMDIFVRAGLRPADAIRAATVHAARVLGMEGRLGSVVVGADADLLLLGENPLEDLGALRRPEAVMSRGVLYDREAIAGLLAAAAAPDP
jgi:imidazolonepropionase-like amidohydrolase